MKTIILAVLGVVGSLVLLGSAAVGFFDARPPASREKLEELFRQGNFKDAYDGYRALALDPKDDPLRVGQDLRRPSSAWSSSDAWTRSTTSARRSSRSTRETGGCSRRPPNRT